MSQSRSTAAVRFGYTALVIDAYSELIPEPLDRPSVGDEGHSWRDVVVRIFAGIVSVAVGGQWLLSVFAVRSSPNGDSGTVLGDGV